ncbi:MAG: T9SS type A sorting domain-containing protein [Saprospiraceae bacterium]|nr:T9SS type A sorting domain-containing protein [Saprospiraceae bacterium]
MVPIANLTAVRHANGSDWWIISPFLYGNGYHKVLLTDTGIVSVTEQYIGQDRTGVFFSQITFSPDGTLFAHCTNDLGLQLYDFDRASGTFGNPRFFPIEPDAGTQAGAGFSPSGRFLYACYNWVLYQYDLWAQDVAASRILVAEYDGYADPIPTHFYMMQLGPDCKLYMFCSSCTTIHVIREPDLPGLACEVVQNDIQLPWGMRGGGAPTFPNYRLGAIGEPVISCGPISGTATPPPVEAGLHLYPNPAGIAITVEWEGAPVSAGMITVRNSMGKEVLQAPAAFFSGRTELRINTLPPGWYSLYVQAGAERRVARLVVQR